MPFAGAVLPYVHPLVAFYNSAHCFIPAAELYTAAFPHSAAKGALINYPAFFRKFNSPAVKCALCV
jgi:hypothetical protein